MGVPPAAGLDKLPRLDRGGGPEDGHEISVPSHLHPQHAEAGVRAVEGDPFYQAGQGFAIVGGTVGDLAIHDAQSSTVDTAVPARASGKALLSGDLRYTVRKHATCETELRGHSCGRAPQPPRVIGGTAASPSRPASGLAAT